MPKNYYIILGIPATSSQDEIKSAYRRLAKEYHPDRYDEGHSPFQTIQEAYAVLSDPKLRRAYDDRRRQRRFMGAHGSRVEPLRTRPEPEPLVPDPAAVVKHFGSEFRTLAGRIRTPEAVSPRRHAA